MTSLEFAGYLAANDIDKVIPAFTERSKLVTEYLKNYNVDDHSVMQRLPKRVKQADGSTVDVEQWKLPVPYQKKIIDIAVSFLYGKPLKLINNSEKGKADRAFELLLTLRKKMRMAAKDREITRLQKSETIAARMFVPSKDEQTGEIKIKCHILAESLGDTIYIKKDIYGSFEAVARGYEIIEGDKKTERFDIYQADFIYYCSKTKEGWAVDKQPEPLGKIRISVWEQEKPEYWDVRHLIRRYEYLGSRRADSNDRVADPILLLIGEKNDVTLPAASEAGKVIITKNGAKAEYLMPQMAMDLVKLERENLKEDIQFFTDTPDISLDKMMKVGTTSGKAMQLLFFQAILKAMSAQEVHEEMQDREVSILKAFMSKYDITLKAECEALEVGYEFGNPLPDNFSEQIDMLSLATGGKPVMSQKRAVDLNPYVTNAEEELLEIQKEESAKSEGLLGGIE